MTNQTLSSSPVTPGASLPNGGAMPTFAEAIANVAMLARVATSAFWDRAIDKRASAEVDHDKHAVTGTARVSIKLLAGASELHNARYALQKQAQSNLNGLSTYWSHGGWRLLPHVNFEAFLGEHTRILGQDRELAAEMEQKAERICQIAAQNLQNFDVPVPTPEKLLSSYSIKEHFQEVPTGRFANAPAGAEDWLRAKFEESFKQQYEHGLMAKLAEVVKPLSLLADRLTAMNEPVRAGDKAPTMRDAVVKNLVAVIDQLESNNLTGDPIIRDFIAQMQLYRNVHPDDLRKNELLRTVAASKAQETIERLRDTLSPFGLV